ncbi:MAG: insulinase family protein [Deltaproteobacteria bacterium]|nr:insulinase family protein [Deltaproteobacteria bacterium]MBW2362282.1 insulinase family protein [Deltaproteobacteria bacterium]
MRIKRALRRAMTLPVVMAAAVLGCRTPAWQQPPPPAAEGPVLEAGALERAGLDNGMQVLVLEDRRLPRVALGLVVRRGAGIVVPEQAGLAGFTAELMKRGAGARDALALAQATDEIGASLSVGSDWDSTSVRVSGLSRDIDRLVEILADVALRPRFEQGEAEKTRAERLAALEKAKDDPATLAVQKFFATLYPGHPYGAPTSGTPESVSALGAADARAFHRRIFMPNDAIFYAAGAVDLESLLPKLGEHFGAWERREVVPEGAPPPERAPEARRIVVVDRPDLGQVRITLGHEGMRRTDPERIAGALMNLVLGGGGFSSRLMTTLRAERGLTYSAGTGFALRRQPGPFYASTFTKVATLRETVELTLAELAKMQREPVTEVELRDAKALLVGRFALGLETSAAVVGSIVNLEVYRLPEDSLDTYRTRVNAVTTDDTARIARTRLHPDRAAIVLVGPAEAIVPQVEDLGPVEVVQP